MAHYHGYQRTDGSIQQRILPLLTPIWEDHEVNDISFLKADTFSWQSGSVYQAVYQHLEQDIALKTLQSETISGITIQYYLANDGHKICPASEESNVDSLFNLVGVAKYFILDTDNTRFKVYREKYNKYSTELPSRGNGMTLGFTNGSTNYGMSGRDASNAGYLVGQTGLYGTTTGTSGSGTYTASGKSFGITTDSTKSGIISSSVADTDMKLYFYVGEFTQSAMANTAGINAELFNQKQDLTIPHIVEDYREGEKFYRVWSNGFIEQGGKETFQAGANIPHNFLKPYTTMILNMQITAGFSSTSTFSVGWGLNMSTTQFTVSSPQVCSGYWYSCGY